MPLKITIPKIKYKTPDRRLMSMIFLSLSFFPMAPAPKTFPISARIFMATQVENIIMRSSKEYTDAKDAAIITQKEITAGFSVFIKKPEVNIAK
jgi:hypothetical protein